MNVLVINAGSSSLKYQLFNMDNKAVLAKGLCERIGIDGRLTHTNPNKEEKYKADVPMKDHADAIRAVINILIDKEWGVIVSYTAASTLLIPSSSMMKLSRQSRLAFRWLRCTTRQT